MSKTKKMSLTYWNALPKDSKKRALTHVFPTMPACVNMLLTDNPNPKDDPWWKLVWSKVRRPEDNSFYKTVVNKTYIP